MVETSFVEWNRDDSGDLHDDSITAGSTLVRIGIRSGVELQVGLTPFDHERVRDGEDDETEVSNGIGDVSLGGKLGLVGGRSASLTIAIQPTVRIPLGSFRSGSGGVGGEVILPISYDLSETVTLGAAPEVGTVGDRAADGQHLRYGATFNVDVQLTRRLSSTVEYRLFRDRDPDFLRTEHVLGVSMEWQAARRFDLDLGVAHGLTANSPGIEITAGFVRHFT